MTPPFACTVLFYKFNIFSISFRASCARLCAIANVVSRVVAQNLIRETFHLLNRQMSIDYFPFPPFRCVDISAYDIVSFYGLADNECVLIDLLT